MRKNPLKLVPNTGSDLKKLRDSSNMVALLLTALMETFVREQPATIKRLLEVVRRHRNQAIKAQASDYEI